MDKSFNISGKKENFNSSFRVLPGFYYMFDIIIDTFYNFL